MTSAVRKQLVGILMFAEMDDGFMEVENENSSTCAMGIENVQEEVAF